MIAKASIASEDIEDIRATDPMAILKGNVRSGTLCNLALGGAVYDTVRTRTVLPLQKSKTSEKEMKIQRMVRIPKIPGDNDSFRLDPDSSSGIYLDAAMEAEYCAVSENWRKQEEATKDAARVNGVKRLPTPPSE